jgi:signal transduction histidine kinase
VVESAESRAPVDVHLDVRGEAALPAELHTALYRVAQEALNTVVRHSGASTARVDIELAAGEVHLVVSDDGCGFEPGAELRLVSALNEGTVVVLDWRDGKPS